MSNDRMARAWDQFQNKLSAHWGKLIVEDARLRDARLRLSTGKPGAIAARDAAASDRLAFLRNGS